MTTWEGTAHVLSISERLIGHGHTLMACQRRIATCTKVRGTGVIHQRTATTDAELQAPPQNPQFSKPLPVLPDRNINQSCDPQKM